METAQLSLLTIGLLAVQCCIAAYMDFRYRRLPNLLCLSVLGTGLVSGLMLHDLFWVGSSLAHGLLALLVGMALWAGSVIGGGDAKFYTATAVWVPLQYGFLFLGAVALCGVVLVLIWFPLRSRIAAMAPSPALASDFKKLPYGIAIAAGGGSPISP